MNSIKVFDSLAEAFEKVQPLKTFLVELEGRSICLANFKDRIHAVENTCPHLGDSLSKGTVNYLGEIICPWHSFRFSLRNGEEVERRCRDVKVYEVIVNGSGEVCVNFQ